MEKVSVEAVFKALAHKARITIVKKLSDAGEVCVCELVDCCGLGWSTVSRHLSVLRDAGIISDEKRGLQVFYRIRLSCVIDFVRCLEKTPCCLPAKRKGIS